MPSPPFLQFFFPIYVVGSVLWLAVIISCMWCYKQYCLVSSSQNIEQGNPTNISEQDYQEGKEQSIGEVWWISSFKEIGNWSECVICLEEFEEGDNCSVLLECKHIYHKACIDKWVIQFQETHCPVCRSSVSIQIGIGKDG